MDDCQLIGMEPWTEEEDAMLAGLVENGLLDGAIARYMPGRNQSAVSRRRRFLMGQNSSGSPRYWTAEEDSQLLRLKGEGWSDASVAELIGVTPKMARRRREKLATDLHRRANVALRAEAARARQEEKLRAMVDKAVRNDPLRAAHVFHLIDLKRAGHSPRFTEFRIGAERPAHMITRRPADRSYCGSHAALCEGA
jgi:hypothetical protein